MEIIKSPWDDKFFELVKNTKESLKLTSPYIKGNVCNKMLECINNDIKIHIITAYKIRNIYLGSLDLDSLKKILNRNGKIFNVSRLHSKIYIFDDKEVVITSSNLTQGGLKNNFEYGVYFNDKEIVDEVLKDFNKLKENDNTGSITVDEINKTEQIINTIPSTIKISLPKFSFENSTESNNVMEVSSQLIEKTLSGWELDIFKCVNQIITPKFSLQDIYKFESKLKQKHPNNNNIKAKIRQQLQNLRDIGLIDFIGNGNYQKLWK